MSTPTRVDLGGRALSSAEGHGLERGALGFWGVFAQGLAAAAPSVAVAVVPFSLFLAAGKGAAWAVVVGLVITVLIAATISFQAKRTVSSGSLGTYTGNGLGPGFAYAAGFSLLIGYIGFATTGTLGGVLYLDSFLESIGLGSRGARGSACCWSSWWSPPRCTCRTAVCRSRRSTNWSSNSIAIASILVIIVALVRRLWVPDRLGAVGSGAPRHQRDVHRGRIGGRLLCRLRECRVAGRRSQGRTPQHRPLAAAGRAAARRALHLRDLSRRFCSSAPSTVTRRCCRSSPRPPASHGSTTS